MIRPNAHNGKFGQQVLSINNTISWTLQAKNSMPGATVSLAVFKVSDDTLVRTLLNGKFRLNGNYTDTWDGKDDSGMVITEPCYISQLDHNINYLWEGGIGNTSADKLLNRHRGPTFYLASCADANYRYLSQSSSEGTPIMSKVTHTDLQTRYDLIGGKGSHGFCICTDGNYVYWGMYNLSTPNETYVFATDSNNSDALVTFSGGTTYSDGQMSYSVIGFDNTLNSTPLSNCVQAAGSYLFIARGGINSVTVLNKTTGVFVRSLSLTNVTEIEIDKNNDNILWTIEGTGNNLLRKYTINSDGTLSNITSVTLANSSSSLAVNATKVLVNDDVTYQVLQYNTTGAISLQTTIGIINGYLTDARVTNYKFGKISWLDFNADGSYMVADSDNYRVQKYSSSDIYVDRFGFIPRFYAAGMDANNPSYLFIQYLQYSRDYTKALDNGANGSWALTHNWKPQMTSVQLAQYTYLYRVATLSNGRTYAQVAKDSYTNSLVEIMPATGVLRQTGLSLTATAPKWQLEKDGSLRNMSRLTPGSVTTFSYQPLTGFDSNNNPLWGATITTVTTPVATADSPGYHGNGVTYNANIVVTNKNGEQIQIIYDPYQGSLGYHMQGIRISDGKVMFSTLFVTYDKYKGDYNDYAFDVGNGVMNAGVKAMSFGADSAFGGYIGEFWKGSQVNKYHHVHSSGHLLGAMGIAPAAGLVAGSAGNASSFWVTRKDADSGYLVHNDEAHLSCLHSWFVSGMTTIQQQAIQFASFANALAPVFETGINLNDGIPNMEGSYLLANTGRFSFGAATTNDDNTTPHYWAKTGLYNLSRKASDVTVSFRSSVLTFPVLSTWNFAELNNATVNNWRLDLSISMSGSNNGSVARFLDIVDTNGLIIARFYCTLSSIKANSKTIVASTDGANTLTPLSIRTEGGLVYFKYAGNTEISDAVFNAGALLNSPAKMVLNEQQIGSTVGTHETTIDNPIIKRNYI